MDVIAKTVEVKCDKTYEEHNSTFLLSSNSEETYGTYKVSIRNDKGFTERYVEFKRPSEGLI